MLEIAFRHYCVRPGPLSSELEVRQLVDVRPLVRRGGYSIQIRFVGVSFAFRHQSCHRRVEHTILFRFPISLDIFQACFIPPLSSPYPAPEPSGVSARPDDYCVTPAPQGGFGGDAFAAVVGCASTHFAQGFFGVSLVQWGTGEFGALSAWAAGLEDGGCGVDGVGWKTFLRRDSWMLERMGGGSNCGRCSS